MHLQQYMLVPRSNCLFFPFTFEFIFLEDLLTKGSIAFRKHVISFDIVLWKERGEVRPCLQYATSPLDVTNCHTLDL